MYSTIVSGITPGNHNETFWIKDSSTSLKKSRHNRPVLQQDRKLERWELDLKESLDWTVTHPHQATSLEEKNRKPNRSRWKQWRIQQLSSNTPKKPFLQRHQNWFKWCQMRTSSGSKRKRVAKTTWPTISPLRPTTDVWTLSSPMWRRTTSASLSGKTPHLKASSTDAYSVERLNWTHLHTYCYCHLPFPVKTYSSPA